MAATKSPQGEPAALPGAVAPDRFQAVGAAAGDEATARTQQRRDGEAIGADQGQQHSGQGCIEMAAKSDQPDV